MSIFQSVLELKPFKFEMCISMSIQKRGLTVKRLKVFFSLLRSITFIIKKKILKKLSND